MEKAVWTVKEVLIEDTLLVVILLLLFLGNLRAAIVVATSLPLAVLATFVIMRLFGWSANIMSLGGLAIAIGLLVDCAVVIVENVEHRLADHHKADFRTRLQITREATAEVAAPLVSGVIIIITVFMPLLSLQGLEGRLFSPVALTISFALASALLLSLTVVPLLSAFLLKSASHHEPWLVRKLYAIYDPALAFAMRRPSVIAALLAVAIGIAGYAFTGIGSTFLPVMDEGTPIVSIRKYPTMSVEEAIETDMLIQRELRRNVPEIVRVIGRAGADELGLDPAGINETDMYMTLAPHAKWRGKTMAWLLGEVRKVLDAVPGISFAFAQPIDMRVQEMIIGARGDVVVKIFGHDIAMLNKLGHDITHEIRRTKGATDVFSLRNAGAKYFTVAIDRTRAGRLGRNATDIQNALRIWVDGKRLGYVIEGAVRTPLLIRGEASARASTADLSRIPNRATAAPSSFRSLQTLVSKTDRSGDPRRTAGFRNGARQRSWQDLVGFVRMPRPRSPDLPPPGYRRMERSIPEPAARRGARSWSRSRCADLLLFDVSSVRQSILVFCNVPFTTIGGVAALRISGGFIGAGLDRLHAAGSRSQRRRHGVSSTC